MLMLILMVAIAATGTLFGVSRKLDLIVKLMSEEVK